MTCTSKLMFATRAIGRCHRSMVGAPVDSSVCDINDGKGNHTEVVFANPEHGLRVAMFVNALLELDRAESDWQRQECLDRIVALEGAAENTAKLKVAAVKLSAHEAAARLEERHEDDHAGVLVERAR